MMPTLPNDKQLRFKVNYRLIMSEYTAIPDSVILTRSELEQRDRKMIADAWEAGEKSLAEYTKSLARLPFTQQPSKQEYIDSILKNNQP